MHYPFEVKPQESCLTQSYAFQGGSQDAYTEAVRLYGAPEIINTDQGSQFTTDAFVAAVAASGAKLSMDGKGAWTDNIFIERFWRSLKYEEVYLMAYDADADAKRVH